MTRKSKARYGMSRTYKLNAAVKALRSALFASLAMAAVAPAAQAACSVVDNTITCTGAFGSTLVLGPGDVALPFDLTTIQLDAGTDIDVNGNFGVNAFSLMDMVLTNDGSIDVYSEIGYAVGIYALSQFGDVAVINNGSVSATSNGGDVAGIVALSAYGEVTVSTGADSSITVETVSGYANGIVVESFAGDVSVDNAGSITATSVSGRAYGIYAYSQYGTVDVDNSGDITAASTSNRAFGVYAASAYDDVSVNNDGDITASSTSNLATGIFAVGQNATVTGYGDVTATTTTGAATGIFARAIDAYGVITIDVGGDVTAETTAGGSAIGIRAYSYAGDVYVTSAGEITASNVNGAAIGILTGRFGYSTVDNSGNITTDTTTGNSIGIQVDSFYGANITNSGDLVATTTNGSARGIQALTTFDVTVDNSGDITATSYTGGSAQGIRAKSTNGYASVTNSGDITATSHFTNAISILATGLYGVEVVNSGDLSADTDYAIAYGIYAQTRFYDASVSNTGDISAHSSYATANGIYSKGGDSSIISNSGDITATSDYANAYGAYAYGQFGAAAIFNSGDITVSAYNDATGLFAKTLYGVAYINNSGDVSVDSQYGIAAYGLYASAFGNTAVVLNYGGAISASSYDTDASAIVAVALDDVVIYNSGDLSAYSYNGDAIGIVGATTDGNVTIYNIGGDISAESVNANAYGIYARSVNGDIEVVSTGDMNISGFDLAAGIYAITDVGNISVYNSGQMTVSNSYVGAGIAAVTQTGDVEVLNAGNIAVDAYAYAVGIVAGAGFGDAYVANSGDFNITAVGPALGIHAEAEVDATVFNLGDISVASELTYAGGILSESDYGDAYVASQGNITATGATYAGGILALAPYGTATVFNSGIISVSAPQGSFGIRAEAEYDVFVANGGSITAIAVNGSSTGIDAVSYDGDVTVYNSGDFVVSGINATGIYTYSTYGDISISNTGDLRATGVDEATGISAGTDEYDSDITISNSLNTIVASAGMNGAAYGIYAYSDGSGDIGITSAGIITATGGKAFGIYAATDNDNSYYGESGVYFAGGNIGITLGAASNITATATNMGSYGEYAAYYGGDASGVYARVEEAYGDISISNAGRISATANGLYATASGIHAYDEYDGTVSITTASTSVISATANGDYGSAFGIYANAYGNVVISNAGSITAGATDASGTSAGIHAYSAYGTSISNTGTIGATGSDPWAIVSYSGGNTVITNGTSGILNGAVYTTDGNDSLTNSGRWNVGNANASYFGGGSDTITNNSGARIFMDGSTIDLGYSEGSSNSFLNNGRLYANGDNVIDMGGSTSVFTNNGSSIHMDDADVNDTLTIIGDFAGTGHIVVNASGASLLADQLYIEGDVAANTANVIDVKLLSGPSIADMLDGETIEIVHVSGTSAAANFNIGVVTPPFDELYTVESSLIKEINYSGSNDRFSLGFDITGLSTAGVVASSVAPGVQSLWNQGTGTLFQREGTHREFNQNPDGSGKAEYKAAAGVWVRGFTSSGSLSPEVSHDNFGAGGSGNFDMDGSGIEFGVGYAFNSQWAAGLLGGTSESTVDPESGGRADIDADTLGAYVTYTPGNGFYADFSYRAMDFDGYGLGGQSEFGFEGSADGYSLEMGYGYKMSSGLIIEPQFQYSSVDVDLDTIGYNASEFELTDGDSSQFRIGAALRKSYKTAGGNYWTPYGALSWLNEADGSNSYEIGGLLTGDVDTGGGSALLEAGVTGFIGGFGLSAGVNWRDGSAYDSVLGGQLSVRYDW